MVVYMNASRLQQFSCVSDTDRMGCSSISGLVAAGAAAAGPYEIRWLAPHSPGELEALGIIQV